MQQIPDVDETIKRLNSHRGVVGVIVATLDGTPIRTTIDNTSTLLYTTGMMALQERCSSIIRNVDPTDELRFMRIRSKRYEVMATTGENYILVVIQNVSSKN